MNRGHSMNAFLNLAIYYITLRYNYCLLIRVQARSLVSDVKGGL
jgi:hypothetical protein